MVVMLALVAGITAIPAYAASNGIYTATATPHYRNPLTGKIEDSGGEDSEVLGQSMTESATDTKALVEVDSNGNTYITVRLKLMDNIQNPTFKVDGSSVSASLMQEDYTANTADYRMKVSSENSVIRCSMYVVPMGRDVVFFITVSNLKSGSGDFVTSITVNNKSNNNSNNANSSNNSYSNNNSGNNNNSSYEPAESSNNSSSSKSSDKKSNKKSDKKKSKETTAPTTVKPSTAVPTTAVTEPTTDSAQEVNGLQEFDEQGSEVTAPATVDEVQNGSYAVWYVIGGVAVVLVAGFCVWYFGFFRKKEKIRRFLRMKAKRIIALILSAVAVVSLVGCVNQHPESAATKTEVNKEVRLVATSPAVAQICSRLNLDLVGVCDTSGTLPEKYDKVKKVGMAMNPDLETIKSLNPDYVLSPSSLESDLQPKYASIGVKSLFLNLKSVDGMYASIEDLGEKFNRKDEADEMLNEFKTFLDKYKDKNKDKKSPKVLVLMGLPGSYIVATDNSYVGSLVKLAGGTNVYGDGGGEEFLTANTEDMQTKDPDIILRAAHALPDEVKEMFAKEFETNDVWKHFRAVQEGKVYDLDSSLFNMSANFSYSDALEALQPLLYGDE